MFKKLNLIQPESNSLSLLVDGPDDDDGEILLNGTDSSSIYVEPKFLDMKKSIISKVFGFEKANPKIMPMDKPKMIAVK